MTFDRERLEKLGFKVVEPTDDTPTTIHFMSEASAEALKANLKSKPKEGGKS
jgi:hypothetical protein